MMDWTQLLSSTRQDQKTNPAHASRTAFEQDFDRIIFSHPFRRLQDKTQVHPLPEHDFVHTRLTHSLEVSSVGRSLGRMVGEVILQRYPSLDPTFTMFDFGAVTAAACLAHDLGNPPFGHAGEDALSEYFSDTQGGQTIRERVTPAEWNDLTRFEGNAQGFRIIHSTLHGLQLTFATLGAFTKYPCASDIKNRQKERKSQKKYGFYQTEKAAFSEVAFHLGLINLGVETWCRHPLAFLVEAADDICYSIIDLEDACRLGLVSFDDTVSLLAGILKDDYQPAKLARYHSLNQKIAILRAMAIGKLVKECRDVFLEHEQEIMSGTFDQALADQCVYRPVLDNITSTSVRQIYRARHVVEIEASGHEILPGILHEFIQGGLLLFDNQSGSPRKSRKYANIAMLLPDETRFGIGQSATFYEMLRHLLDLVSGLTDKHALSLYRKLKGISL